MINIYFMSLLNKVYGTNLILASMKSMNFSDSGARKILNTPMTNFSPLKHIQKIKKRNPQIKDTQLQAWQELLEEFTTGVNTPAVYCKKTINLLQGFIQEATDLPIFTLGCLTYSEAAISKFINNRKSINSEIELLSVFPNSIFTSPDLSTLALDLNDMDTKNIPVSLILLIASLDLDLELMGESFNKKHKEFGLSVIREYSNTGINPVSKWVSNIHIDFGMTSKEDLYKKIYTVSDENLETIRRRFKSWQSGTRPTHTKLNELFYTLTPNSSSEDFICYHMRFTLRSLIGLYNYSQEGQDNIYDIEKAYHKSREYLLKEWPI